MECFDLPVKALMDGAHIGGDCRAASAQEGEKHCGLGALLSFGSCVGHLDAIPAGLMPWGYSMAWCLA